MKIFDCVTFFEENRQMNLRFNILDNYVDQFVVCEGKYDHQGRKKQINFNVNNYKKFKKKITHVIVENFPKNLNPWERQAFQREQILKNINQAKEDDLILFSDPDEIPNLSNFKKIEFKKKYIIFLQDLFYYKLNIKEVGFGNNWEGTRGCLKKNLKSIDYMRQKVLKKNLKYNFFRIDKEKNIQIFHDAGWHFSDVMTVDQISLKLKTFAHVEFSNEKFSSKEVIKKKIDNLEDLFGRGHKYEVLRLNDNFPKYILEHKNEFHEFII